MSATNDHRATVRRRYAAFADAATTGDTACGADEADRFGSGLYEVLDGVPEAAARASLGCGNPTAVADLREGDVVLDLGSGGGIDVLLSARRVGSSGRAYGVDFTPEMLALARANAAAAGVDNVEFLEGRIEDVPLPDGSIDVVISNCVVNLSSDKPAVFAEMHRLLRPGGRIGISDVVADESVVAADRSVIDVPEDEACAAGALTVAEYRSGLEAVGFVDVHVTFTHEVGTGFHAAIVKAVRPPPGGSS
jgi:SAM-dependent methyltransferase